MRFEARTPAEFHVDPLAAMFRALITATAGNATAAVSVQAQ
jgi:hypothetical protein